MALQTNWLAVKPALNALRTTYGIATIGGTGMTPIFLLSPDTEDELKARIIGRAYDRGILNTMLPATNNFAPTKHEVLPAEATVDVEGDLQLRWQNNLEGTVYPVWDTLAQSLRTAQPRSFAAYIGESHLVASTTMTMANRLAITSTNAADNAKGVVLFVTGTVGPKGSGADLELEDVESWRPGRPLYLPDNELTLPFRLARNAGHTPEPETDPKRWFERWGPRGNIARSGTNGLTAASYSASSGVAEHAFNGNIVAGTLYSSATRPASFDPVWRHLKPGTHYYTTNNLFRPFSQRLPASKNFTIELKLPDGEVAKRELLGFWGPYAGKLRFDVYGNAGLTTETSSGGYLFKNRDGAMVIVDEPIPAGSVIQYTVTDGTHCKISVNGVSRATVEITGEPLDLSELEGVGSVNNDSLKSFYSTPGRRPIEHIRISNDETAGEMVQDEWVQVTFPRRVTRLRGVTVFTGDTVTSRLPKSCKVQVSDDGITFRDHEIIELKASTEQLINFIEKVDVQAIRLTALDNHGSPHCTEIGELEVHYELPVDTKLTRTGVHRNVALLGTNGLTKDSFTASRSDNGAQPYRAFNGWQDNRKINQQAPAPDHGYSFWEANNVTYEFSNQWLQADLGQRVAGLVGLSLRPYEWDTSLSGGGGSERAFGQSPKEISVRVSDNGETFADVWSGTLDESGFQRVVFDTPVTGRYLRVFIYTPRTPSGSSYSRYVSIREMEIYQELPEAQEA